MSATRNALLVAAALAVAACVSQDPYPNEEPYRPSRYRRNGQPVAPAPAVPTPVQPATPAGPPPPLQPQPDKYAHLPSGEHIALLEMRGMTCPVKCTREVKEQLGEAPGVQSVMIDYGTKTAIVRLEPGADRTILPRYVRPPYSAHLVR